MALKFNNENISLVQFNGVYVNELRYNGTTVWTRTVAVWHTVFSGSVIQNSLDANPNSVDFGGAYTLPINSSAQQVRVTGKAGLYDDYSNIWSSYNESSATLTSKSNSMVNVVSIIGINADSYLDSQWSTNNDFSAQARNTFWNYDYNSIPVVEITLVEAYYL